MCAVMGMTGYLRLLFAALISIGLALSPLLAAGAPPAVANASMQMADMSDGMPCCPDKQKPNDCQDCPFLAICMAKVVPSDPSASGVSIRDARSRTLHPVDEPAIASLTRPPPDHPPRSII
jgi:hypothetical protein